MGEETKDKEKKKKEVERTKYLKKDGEESQLFEAVDGSFLTFNSNAGLMEVPDIEAGDFVFVPAKQGSTPYSQYRKPNILDPDISDIYQRIFDIVDSYWDHDEIIFKHVICCFVIGSYLQEKFTTAPYLFFFGDNESGKTRALELVDKFGYRSLFGTSFPPADIFTFLGAEETATLCEDEIQGLERETDKIKIYKAGYRKGARVPRITITPSGKRVVEYYPAFGFKAVAAERLPGDFLKGFRERMIEIQCIEGEPTFDEFREEDLVAITELRNELLVWRVRNFNSLVLPDVGEKLKGRVKEKWKPLLQVAKLVGGICWNTMAQSIDAMIKDRLETKQQSFEGRLVKVCLKAVKDNKSYEVLFDGIWDRLRTELDAYVDDRKPDELKAADFERPITKNWVGRRINDILDAKTKRRRQGEKIRVYRIFSPSKIKRAAKRYRYDVTELLNLPLTKDVKAEEEPTEASPEAESAHPEAEPAPLTPPQEDKIGNSVTGQNKFRCLIKGCGHEAGSLELLRLHQETAHGIDFSKEKVEYCIFPEVFLEGE